MAVTIETLQEFAQALVPVRIGPQTLQPGESVQFKLQPTPTDMTVSEMIDRSVDLTWLTKNVRFKEAAPLPKPIQQYLNLPQQVFDNVLRIPYVRQIVSALNPGVPGLLGQAGAALKLPMDLSVPLALKAKWKVTDEAGAELAADDAFVSTTGLSLPEISLAFAPPTIEAKAGQTLAPVTRKVSAAVQLTAGPVTTPWIELLHELPVKVMPIPVPTVLGLFVLPSYNAGTEPAHEPNSMSRDPGALIVVPTNSPFTSINDLDAALSKLRNIATTFNTVARFASLATGLPSLPSGLAGLANVHFDRKDRIDNLNDYTLIARSLLENDTEAEDEISSMLFVGASGKTIECFNERNLGTGQGAFRLKTGNELFVAVPNLDAANPTSVPAAGFTRISAPAGQRFESISQPIRNVTTFGNEVSSLRFL